MPGIKLEFGGAGRDRTGDLLVANEALSQLSYSPTDISILAAENNSRKQGLTASGISKSNR